MSGINIDDLTEAELIDLKRRIAERLKTQNYAKALKPRLDKLNEAGISLNEIVSVARQVIPADDSRFAKPAAESQRWGL